MSDMNAAFAVLSCWLILCRCCEYFFFKKSMHFKVWLCFAVFFHRLRQYDTSIWFYYTSVEIKWDISIALC